MDDNHLDFLLVLGAGALVGLLFAYIARGIETPARALILLATVQGSFLAIVISVFLLSLQVNANVFSPLTLEQFGRPNILTGLILLYVSSILLDLLHLITLSNPLFQHGLNLNTTLGIPVGVATVCLLSLIPIQQVMADLVAPETILRRTADNADTESLIQDQSELNRSTIENIEPPKRTPLLTIEQVLISSSNRDDEFTVRQSIYYMSNMISDFLQNYPDTNSENEDTETDLEITDNSDINQQCAYIFEHWRTCIEIGTNGEKGRIELLNATHLRLTNLLIKEGHTEPVNNRLDELASIHLQAFEIDYIEPELLESYSDLVSTAIDADETNLIEPILSSRLRICEDITTTDPVDQDYIDYLSGERRDVVSGGLSHTINNLKTITEREEISKGLRRRTSKNAINRIDTILVNLINKLQASETENADAQGIEHNILTELQSSLLSVLSSIYETDKLIAKNLAIAAVELSVHREQNPDRFRHHLEDEVPEDNLLCLLNTIQDTDSPESLRQMSPADREIELFIQELGEQTS